MEYLIVKWLHVLSSTVLFGTGLGSAFYMFTTNRSRDVRAIAVVVRRVVMWTALGWPVFAAFIAIFFLMVVKPAI